MEESVDKVITQMKDEMKKTLSSYKKYLTTVKTGRAHVSVFEGIKVESYGQQMQLKQLATISTPDAMTVVIQPWDVSIIKEIEKAILKANMGFTPQNDGKIIKINIPPMTEEDRKKVVKLLKQESENYKVALRNARKKALKTIKDLEKEKIISEDESKRAEKEVKKALDDSSKKLDELMSNKEKEILNL
ncbi:ribosome recycling factor [Hippea maritima]|uniref:Ribosome-recycling factor n=1 Tax=Hippea maritima (strain ATCC 700847 / DSM 10411 / MH2) TaxID=760142 RepID=F2LTT9_HIPMA|nr:ribosome recycling factor [Hippea maritima]AEA34465.1 Ribosome-recycling factor [Hippea maritima DSM 10411]